MKPPKGYFITKIFHPNISTKGEICVNTLKKDWEPTNWSLRNILQVVRCLLIVPFPESSLNEEAGKMFMENYEEYSKHARVFTSVYAKPKMMSPIKSDENNAMDGKMDLKPVDTLPFTTQNPNKPKMSLLAEAEQKAQAKTVDKKKWTKRL